MRDKVEKFNKILKQVRLKILFLKKSNIFEVLIKFS